MLDLKEISSVQTQTARLTEQRQQKSFDHCRKGFECLMQAEQQGFRNKQLLQQACDAFAEAIANDRLAPEAYFGMGYLLYLLKDYTRAMPYLTEAIRLAPEQPDARELLEMIHQENKAPKSQAPVIRPAPVEVPPEPDTGADDQLDYDRLYDKVEAHILSEVSKVAAGVLRPPVPSLDLEEIEKFNRLMHKHQGILKDIHAQLHILEEEIDISDLRGRLKPLEIAVKRYQQVLQVSHEMREIQQGIQGLMERLPGLNQQLYDARNHEDLGILERLIEVLMDMCDQMADRLDEFEKKKYPVQPLIQSYETFVSEVGNLHDQFDEKADQFPK